MEKLMIDHFYDPIERISIYSLNGINDTSEEINIPSILKSNNRSIKNITYIGYKEIPDTRDEYEKWKDSYFYQYIRPLSLEAISIEISKNIKKIVLPKTITSISDKAFKNIKGVIFEIETENEFYYTSNGSIFNKKNNKIIYKYEEIKQ